MTVPPMTWKCEVCLSYSLKMQYEVWHNCMNTIPCVCLKLKYFLVAKIYKCITSTHIKLGKSVCPNLQPRSSNSLIVVCCEHCSKQLNPYPCPCYQSEMLYRPLIDCHLNLKTQTPRQQVQLCKNKMKEQALVGYCEKK